MRPGFSKALDCRGSKHASRCARKQPILRSNGECLIGRTVALTAINCAKSLNTTKSRQSLETLIRQLNYPSFRFNAVLRGKLGGEWHWAVWDADRRKLLDPYKPGGKFRCTSFIKVVSRAHSCARRTQGAG